MIDTEVIGQTPGRGRPDPSPREPSGVARRVRETVLGTAETGRAAHAARKAARREEARPALHRASRAARDAEQSLAWLKIELEDTCAAWVRGDADEEVAEAAVRAVEMRIEEAQRDVRRYSAAARSLERQFGVIRDPAGHIIDSGL